MRQSRPVKKRKKERTWAEAIIEVLERSTSKVLGYQEIHEKIILYKLKDIKMAKPDEKVLKTMLAQHASASNCPFYKVKDRPGYYALKETPVYLTAEIVGGSDADSPLDVNEDSNGSGNSVKRKSRRKAPSPNIIIAEQRNTESKKRLLTDKVLSDSVSRRSNLYTGNALKKAQLLARRRTSSPNVMPSFVHANLRNRPQLQQVHRSRSTNSLQKSSSNFGVNRSRTQPGVDLETPSSVLTNTKLKSVINSTTFAMLPASYQYQLIQLLPQVDHITDENGVPRMTQAALNNEFFSQALQDWVTQLSEGEFTRETQARIMQEIAKERSKISPWKEHFFEEYYGQKKELKRTRSRSHDATLNLDDLSFEAQLVKFQHLRSAADDTRVKGEEEDDNEIIAVDSESESDQDPNYVDNGQPVSRPTTKDASIKPINRRKIRKPFKRMVMNAAGDYSQNTSMIHRKATAQHATKPPFNRFVSNTVTKFKPSAIIRNHPDFQVRDEMYRSDSEASDAGELSDSNSFHQHDETDEEGESSDGMMNLGDDNLMDVDDDSDSEDFEGPNSDTVSTDHSYTRLLDLKGRRRSSDDRERRRPMQVLASVRPVLSNDDSKTQQPAQNTTLVLRPRGNLGQTVLAIDCSEDSSSTSPEQPYKRPSQGQPMFDKIVAVSKENTSKEERVGVLFGRGVPPTANACYGESIVPRISTTSGLLSSPITPTTVCTSTSSSRISQEAKNNKFLLQTTPYAFSEYAMALKTKPGIGDSAPAAQYFNPGAIPRTRSFAMKFNFMEGMARDHVTEAHIGDTDAPVDATRNSPVLSNNRELNFPRTNMAHVGSSSQSSVGADYKLTSKAGSDTAQNVWHGTSATEETVQPRTSSPVLTAARRNSPTLSPSKSATDQSKGSPVLFSTPGNKRPQSANTSSPVKRTRTLAEIKAQMKAKKLAAVSASPGNSVTKAGGSSQLPGSKPPVKIAQPVFCPTPPSRNVPPVAQEDNNLLTPTGSVPVATKDEISLSDGFYPLNEDLKHDISEEKKNVESGGSSPKNGGKIILKIKAEEGKKYSVKVDTANRTVEKNSDSEDDVIVRKNRRLSQVILSSGESSDDFDQAKDSKLKENYGMLSQLALPGSYTAKATVSVIDHHTLLKRTQKSPVFGEPAFEGLSTRPKSVSSLPTAASSDNVTTEVKSQPFVSDKPVIGFQDIPSCTALTTSNTPTFVHPSTSITVAPEAQKYRSTSKGKSLVQMQQLARSNRIPSDESELADSDTEDDSTVSTTSSAEDETVNETSNKQDAMNKTLLKNRSAVNKTNRLPEESGKKLENGPCDNESTGNKEESDCEDSYSSSSYEEKTVITECICACKRLVLCKGCGAYTHEECLSSTRLCSLCV